MSKIVERCERALLYTILGFLYIAPLKYYIYPINNSITKFYIPCFIVTSVLSFVYATLCLCFRGFVVFPEAKSSSTRFSSPRSCSICVQPKPERSHHCSQCKRCIKKMDHHCHWLGRCINYDNHGHFIRFLLFTFLSTFSLLMFNLYFVIQTVYLDRMDVNSKIASIVISSSIIGTVLALVTGIHFASQMQLIVQNTTFLEHMQKRNLELISKKCGDSPYNMGVYSNFTDVLGPAKYLFLWMPTGDGMTFKKRWETEFWPKASAFKDDECLYEEV